MSEALTDSFATPVPIDSIGCGDDSEKTVLLESRSKSNSAHTETFQVVILFTSEDSVLTMM